MLRYALSFFLVATSLASAQEIETVRGTFRAVNDFGQMSPAGQVSVASRKGRLVIELSAKHLAAGTHLAHIHGFTQASPKNASCPDRTADSNGDGFIDLIETREVSGVTMIPFTEDPVSLEIHSETYPSADETGELRYRISVDPEALSKAVEAKFSTPLELGKRVVFIHGAPEDADLPDSVASLEGVPARVTIPIACAELDPVGG